mmetsp:Transcript_7659/g.28691  ORF Transcript_7659/g.28691 Transcript_7659/m.28691 type:complete len:365 (+) Transcript_7659:274-1368(+)
MRVFIGDKVNADSLSSITSRTSNSVQVALLNLWKIIVDYQTHMMHIDTTSHQIGCNQNSGRTSTELTHGRLSFLVRNVSVNLAHSEITVIHGLCQPVNLLATVAKDYRLGNGKSLVQVAKYVQLVLLSLHINVKLFDTLQGESLALHQNLDWGAHEFLSNLEYLLWHGSREKANLHVLWKVLENGVQLLLESLGEHLVGLIDDQHLESVNTQVLLLNHVSDTSWGSYNNVDSLGEDLNIVLHVGSSYTSVNLHFHVLGERHDNLVNLDGQLTGWSQYNSLSSLLLLIDSLQNGNGEGGGLSCSGLSLPDYISRWRRSGNWENASLLNLGRLYKTIRVDSSEKSSLQLQIIEIIDDAVVVVFGRC